MLFLKEKSVVLETKKGGREVEDEIPQDAVIGNCLPAHTKPKGSGC